MVQNFSNPLCRLNENSAHHRQIAWEGALQRFVLQISVPFCMSHAWAHQSGVGVGRVPERREVIDLATPNAGPAMLTYTAMCSSTQLGSSSVAQTMKLRNTLSPQLWLATSTCSATIHPLRATQLPKTLGFIYAHVGPHAADSGGRACCCIPKAAHAQEQQDRKTFTGPRVRHSRAEPFL